MKTETVIIEISGIPSDRLTQVKEDMRRLMLKKHKFIFTPTNHIKISFDQCYTFTNLDAFYSIMSASFTVDAMQQEIKNGN